MNEITQVDTGYLKEIGVSQQTFSAMQNSLYPGASVESIVMVAEYCKARGLDPLRKPVHIVPMNVKDAVTGQYGWRDVVMPGIAEYRTTAMRTGKYAGTDAPDYGEEKELLGVTAPEFCRFTVYRMIEGHRVPFTYTEYFSEAAATKRDGGLNSMWTKRPRGQLTKCAEAGALRMAFPEELGGEHTADEMEGKDMGAPVDVTPQREALPQLESYSPEAFREKLSQWQEKVSEGKPPENIVATISTKFALTDEQRKQILALKPEEKEAA